LTRRGDAASVTRMQAPQNAATRQTGYNPPDPGAGRSSALVSVSPRPPVPMSARSRPEGVHAQRRTDAGRAPRKVHRLEQEVASLKEAWTSSGIGPLPPTRGEGPPASAAVDPHPIPPHSTWSTTSWTGPDCCSRPSSISARSRWWWSARRIWSCATTIRRPPTSSASRTSRATLARRCSRS